MAQWIDEVGFDEEGLIPAIAQDESSGRVLMMAWMNREALLLTAEKKQAVYWSRSRGKLWHKGETSGEIQHVHAILTDCDQDAVVLKVKAGGRGATCHTGRVSCFYRQLEGIGKAPATARLKHIGKERLFDPDEVYGKSDPAEDQ